MNVKNEEVMSAISRHDSLFECKSAKVFYPRLVEDGRKKIPMQCVQHVFTEMFPEYQNSENIDVLLKQELRKLTTLQLIEFPDKVNEVGWVSEESILPTYIKIITRDSSGFRDPSRIEWVDELAFCKNISRAKELLLATQINNFLKARGRRLMAVPIRERSLQIFGDEKKLEEMVVDGWLFNGNLSISAIGAFELAKPLTYQASGAHGKPILAIENSHTYWSFCKWNARTKEYSAILLGSGCNFQSDARSIDILMGEINADGIEYFGDLDSAGLAIPVAFNIRRNWSKQKAMPAKRFYEWLLVHGIRRNSKSATTASKKDRTESFQWLDSIVLETGVRQLFGTNLWIPQESLGTEALHDDFSNSLSSSFRLDSSKTAEF